MRPLIEAKKTNCHLDLPKQLLGENEGKIKRQKKQKTLNPTSPSVYIYIYIYIYIYFG